MEKKGSSCDRSFPWNWRGNRKRAGSSGHVCCDQLLWQRGKAQELKTEIEQNGGEASIYKCDVSDNVACKEFIGSVIAEYGHLDVLVNNAGITRDGLLMRMSEEDFDAVLDTNLKGAFHTIRAVSRQMLKQRSGRIVNLSSVVGVSGNAGQANYAASKAGIIGLTKSCGKRAWLQRNYCECSSSWIY